jgi:hypothetical protein
MPVIPPVFRRFEKRSIKKNKLFCVNIFCFTFAATKQETKQFVHQSFRCRYGKNEMVRRLGGQYAAARNSQHQTKSPTPAPGKTAWTVLPATAGSSVATVPVASNFAPMAQKLDRFPVSSQSVHLGHVSKTNHAQTGNPVGTHLCPVIL